MQNPTHIYADVPHDSMRLTLRQVCIVAVYVLKDFSKFIFRCQFIKQVLGKLNFQILCIIERWHHKKQQGPLNMLGEKNETGKDYMFAITVLKLT